MNTGKPTGVDRVANAQRRAASEELDMDERGGEGGGVCDSTTKTGDGLEIDGQHVFFSAKVATWQHFGLFLYFVAAAGRM